MNTSGAERMTSYLRRIATGPEMSKDLTLDEARDGMSLILDRKVEPIQAAVYLIALRMKRESTTLTTTEAADPFGFGCTPSWVLGSSWSFTSTP